MAIVAHIGRRNLRDWALARAFTMSTGDAVRHNASRAGCFICGRTLEKGEGEKVGVRGVHHLAAGTRYICAEDALMVRVCRVKYPK